MKKLLLFSLALIIAAISVQAQYIKIPEGSLNFLQNNVTVINFKVDLSTTTVNKFRSIDEWVDYNYKDVKAKEDESEAEEWKESWESALKEGLEGFRLALNDELEAAPIVFRQNTEDVAYTAVLKVTEIQTGRAFANSPATITGTLSFYDSNGKLIATVDIIEYRGIPGGGMPMRLKTAFRRTGGALGEKIYLEYFK